MGKPEVMPFGMHKGKAVTELPVDYAKWLLKTVEFKSESLRTAVLKRTKATEKPKRKRQRALAGVAPRITYLEPPYPPVHPIPAWAGAIDRTEACPF